MPAFGKVGPGNTVRTTIEIPPEMLMTALEAITGKSKQEIEALGPEGLSEILKGIDLTEALKDHIDLEQLKNEALNKALQEPASSGMMSFYGDFAVSDDTYYVEYEQRLFRWKPGMTAWFDTGLKDEAEPPLFLTSILLSTPRRLISFNLSVSNLQCPVKPFTLANGMDTFFNRLMKGIPGMMSPQISHLPLPLTTQ